MKKPSKQNKTGKLKKKGLFFAGKNAQGKYYEALIAEIILQKSIS